MFLDAPRFLFEVQNLTYGSFVVHSDGERLVVVTGAGSDVTSRINVVLNWLEELTEGEIIGTYKELRSQCSSIAQKIGELEMERNEHGYVPKWIWKEHLRSDCGVGTSIMKDFSAGHLRSTCTQVCAVS